MKLSPRDPHAKALEAAIFRQQVKGDKRHKKRKRSQRKRDAYRDELTNGAD